MPAEDGPLLMQGQVLQDELTAGQQEQAEETADGVQPFPAVARMVRAIDRGSSRWGEGISSPRLPDGGRRSGVLSACGRGHRIYPYLPRNVRIEGAAPVWSTDITYVSLANGFVHLAAFIDWFNRYVLAWHLSNTLDGSFCLEMLEEALPQDQPEAFNTNGGRRHSFWPHPTSAFVKAVRGEKGCLGNRPRARSRNGITELSPRRRDGWRFLGLDNVGHFREWPCETAQACDESAQEAALCPDNCSPRLFIPLREWPKIRAFPVLIFRSGDPSTKARFLHLPNRKPREKKKRGARCSSP